MDVFLFAFFYFIIIIIIIIIHRQLIKIFLIKMLIKGNVYSSMTISDLSHSF